MPSDHSAAPADRPAAPAGPAAVPEPGSASRGSDLGHSALRYLTAPADPDPAALGRETLVGRARQAVLDLIDEEGLGTGDPLPSVGALAERFAVSRAVVREALSALDALGIVEISNGRAARVRPPDGSLVRFSIARTLRTAPGEGFAALMDVRAPLEVRAAVLAARRVAAGGVDAGELDALRTLLAQMEGALGDSAEYPRLDLRLHTLIAELAASPALQGVLEAVSTPLFRAMRELRVTREARGLVGAEHAEHGRIVTAILAGDAEAASAAMAEHMAAVEAFDDALRTSATR